MKYTTIVFDCDGTLLNTATDLANAVNHVLRTHNFPEKSLAEIKAALGNAVTYLMRQCLPSSVADNELEPYIEEFKAYYGEHLKDTTAPYPGILDMLDVLREQGYKLAESGDIVLLSPACASFDWYSCFEERGDDFKACVQMLQEGGHH